MAMRAQSAVIGVDVAKSELVLYRQDSEQLSHLRNEPQAIEAYLKALDGPVEFAIEATGSYHLQFLEQADHHGHRIYLIDGYRLSNYREAVGERAKTDACDARLLARFLEAERHRLKPWQRPPKAYRQAQRLLRRRAALVRLRVSLEQSLSTLPELKEEVRRLRQHIERLEAKIERLVHRTVRQVGWAEPARRCQAIEGIGPLTSAALTIAYHRGRFKSSDSFVAFLGLDVRPRDTGKKKGLRKLSKQGDPELRRLLYLAALRAKETPAWADYYQRFLNRGLSKIQAHVILARKLARVAFALLANGSTYVPQTPKSA